MQSVEADSAYLLSTCYHINCELPIGYEPAGVTVHPPPSQNDRGCLI